ncbi:(2Fe-2S)-binding protein [Actinorugispora endophytica]|uniref:Ferric iron reductase FhuF-like transporter n=1 Tax=Actinorugispora endophytica TaxID=1605990 RepID=A0A4R6UPS7_9ACTN|nr:(2Fe-2S)-binding protein [Actinorugispora endophytica]TDQ49228.1 ferric iron reductase FhuF-like transporter [Actinorugispora endophytica]
MTGVRGPGADGGATVVTRAIEELTRLGGFFALVPVGPGNPPPGLRSFAELYERPGLLGARIESARQRYGAVEPRVCASVVHLGFAARLVSPSLAAACAGVVLELPPASLFWQDAPDASVSSRIAAPRGVEVDPADAAGVADLLRGPLVEHHLRPLGAAVRSGVKVSERLLWGNAASAVGGAVQMLSRLRPEWADRADAIGTALIGRGPTASLGSVVRPDTAGPHRFFVRRSCCLYYRLPGGGLCGDCALLDPATRLGQWRAAMAERPL